MHAYMKTYIYTHTNISILSVICAKSKLHGGLWSCYVKQTYRHIGSPVGSQPTVVYTSWAHGHTADNWLQHYTRLASATRHGVFPDSYCSRLQSSLVELTTTVSDWSLQQLCTPELDLQWPSAFAGCPRSELADRQLQTHIVSQLTALLLITTTLQCLARWNLQQTTNSFLRFSQTKTNQRALSYCQPIQQTFLSSNKLRCCWVVRI